MLARIGYNLLQVFVVLAFAPLVEGVASRLKEILQSKRGPSIFQPYRDIWKLLHKDEIVSEYSSWIFRAAPYVAFAAPVFVALLIPVLTRYPLFFAFMGDMLGGGFILALGGFFATLAAVDTANPYGPMGASRTRMVGFLAEPVFIVVFLTVSFVAGSTIPYIVQMRWITPIANFFEPSHVLLMIAFLMLILAEDGRIPVDSPSGQFELAMIDRSKSLEYSGRGAALTKWAGAMKFFVLICIFLNVLVTPWGLAQGFSLGEVLLAIPLCAFQDLRVRSRSRVHRILACQTAFVPHPGISWGRVCNLGCRNDHAAVANLGAAMNSSLYQVISALDALTGALFLLTALGVVATRQVLASLQLFIMQSLLLALSAGLIGIASDSIHLLAVAAITIATKTLMIPWLLRRTVGAEVYRTREIERVLNIPSSLLLAAVIIVLAYVVAYPLLGAVKVPFGQINLPLGIAAMFLGAFTIVVRREAVPQLLGLLAVENGVFFAGIAIVPDLPVIAELAAAVDVPAIALVVGLLARSIHRRVGTTAVGGLSALGER